MLDYSNFGSSRNCQSSEHWNACLSEKLGHADKNSVSCYPMKPYGMLKA